jgi:transposase
MNNKAKLDFVGLDVSKELLAVSVADESRGGEVRDWGTISATLRSVERLFKKLALRAHRVEVCYEVGPTEYGLHRQITAFGFDCSVVKEAGCSFRTTSRASGLSRLMYFSIR